jgi:hypothetical protein
MMAECESMSSDIATAVIALGFFAMACFMIWLVARD